MIRKLSIGPRLTVGFAIILVLMGVMGSIGASRLLQLDRVAEDMTDNRYPKTVWANDVLRQEGIVARSVRNAALLHDPQAREAQFRRIDAAQHDVAKDLQQLTSTVRSPRDEAVLSRVRDAENTFKAGLASVTSQLRGGNDDAAVRQMTGDLHRDNEALFDDIEALIRFQSGRMSDAAQAAKQTYVSATEDIALSGGIAVLLAIVLAFVLTRSITRPLHQANAMLKDIADGDGDLTGRLDQRGNDEVTALAGSFNRFVARLQNMVRTITDATTQVATASEELSAVTEQASVGANQQRAETEQVAAAMNQMAATVQEVAGNAARAAEAAEQADRDAATGRSVVTSTTTAIESLAAEVERAAQVISRTAQETANIEAVLDVIKEITEQTNLLALNAAIEAARAGEQGRGFTVVAGEVRTLAQRTQQSTEEIENMIERLQSGARESTTVMERSQAGAAQAVEEAGRARQAIESVLRSVATITDMNAQIASAAEEQSAVAGEINRNISNISQISEQSAAGAVQTAGAGTELARLGAELSSMVAQFKV